MAACTKKNLLVFLVMSIAGLFVLFPVSANFIRNPSFEAGKNDQVTDWRTLIWNNGNVEFKIVDGVSHSGSRSLVIDNKDLDMGSCSQVIDVQSGKTYRFSCWIKTESVGTGPNARGAHISINTNPEKSIDIKGDNGWSMVELYIIMETPADSKILNKIVVHLNLGDSTALNTGRAYFDDVVFEEVNEAPGNSILTRIKGDEQQTINAATEEGLFVDTAGREREKRTQTIVILVIAMIVLIISGRALYRIIRKAGKRRVLQNKKAVVCRYDIGSLASKQYRLGRIASRKFIHASTAKKKTVRSKKTAGKKSKPE